MSKKKPDSLKDPWFPKQDQKPGMYSMPLPTFLYQTSEHTGDSSTCEFCKFFGLDDETALRLHELETGGDE